MISITLNKQIVLKSEELPPSILKQLKEDLIIDNPKYLEAQRNGRFTQGIAKRIELLKKKDNLYTLPRGYFYKLIELVKKKDYYCVFDEQLTAPSFPMKFKGELKRDQLRGGLLVLEKDYGVLKAPTGSGKTVIALWTMAKRGVTTLIVVHTKELMYQWKDKISQFLEIPERRIGLLGDGHGEVMGITVGIINTLAKMDIKTPIGCVIVDECHRVPATTFSKVVERLNTKYLLGLTATDCRSDGLDALIYHHMGDLAHEIKTKNLQENGRILKPELRVIKTNFSFYMRSVYQRHAMLKKLIADTDRNELIVREVKKQVAEHPNGIALIISDRVGHCLELQQMLDGSALLTGSTKSKVRREIIEKLQRGEGNTLIATGQLIGEGFDLPSLSSIFLTMPIKFSGRLQQYIGRIVRVEEGKEKAVVYDFNDGCWLLQHSLKSRMEHYREMGIMPATLGEHQRGAPNKK